MKRADSVRNSKGFLFEAEDTREQALCRDLRGFPRALLAARGLSEKHPGRLVVIVPDLAMDAWIAAWATDTSEARRRMTITRQVDGQKIRIVGTLLCHGQGVATTIRIESLETSRGEDEAPESGVRALRGAGKRVAL